MQKLLVIPLLATSLFTTGCTGLLFGGAAVGGAAVASTVHDRRSAGRVIDDRTLQTRVERNISADKYLNSYSHINATVYNATVLLTGEASSQSVKQRVIEIAQKTPGAKRVEADITVGAKSSLWSRGNDTAITAKVKTALLSLKMPNFDPSLVKITTERGNVYLMGFVSQNEGEQVAEKTRRVAGVKSVTKVFEYLQ